MKTLQKTLMMSALFIATSSVSFANTDKPPHAENSMNFLKEISLDSDFHKYESMLIEDGVIQCDEYINVKILDQNDSIVYEGVITRIESAEEEVAQLIKSADHLLTVGQTSYYKLF
jgi:hypothetical protein